MREREGTGRNGRARGGRICEPVNLNACRWERGQYTIKQSRIPLAHGVSERRRARVRRREETNGADGREELAAERAPVEACAKKAVSLVAHSVLSLRPCADLPHLRTAENIVGGYYLPLYPHYWSLPRRRSLLTKLQFLGSKCKVCDQGLAGISVRRIRHVLPSLGHRTHPLRQAPGAALFRVSPCSHRTHQTNDRPAGWL